MSFESQLNHEVQSFSTANLISHAQELMHLGNISVVLANYQIKEHWFSSPTIEERFPDMEVCSTQRLETHLQLKSVQTRDKLALGASDAQIIKRITGNYQ